MSRKLLTTFIVAIMLVTSFATLRPSRAADPVVIRWRTRVDNDAEQKVYQQISDSVSKQLESQGITLKYEPQPVNGYFPNLKTQLASGTAPDIYWVGGANLAEYVSNNWVLDLASLAKDDKDFDVKQFYAQPIAELTRDGHLWGLPRDISTLVVYYNEDLFTEAGLQTPAELAKAGKWDWDALLKASQKLTDPKAGTYGFGHDAWWGPLGYWIFAGGGSFFNADKTKCALNSEGAAKGIQFLADAYNKYKVSPLPGSKDAGEALWDNGKEGIFFNGRWMTPSARAQAKFKWGVAELPKGPGGNFTWLFWGPYLVNAKTAHSKEAWTVIKAITSADNQGLVAALGSNIPSRDSDAARAAFLKSTPPADNTPFIAGTKYAGAEFPLWTGSWDDIDGNIIEPELSNVFQGKETVADFSKTICAKIDPKLSAAGAAPAATAAK